MNRCKTAKNGNSWSGSSNYCEVKDNDIVITCDEMQSPDPHNNLKTEMLLDCDARKFHVRSNVPGTLKYQVKTFNLVGCPNQQIDRMVM